MGKGNLATVEPTFRAFWRGSSKFPTRSCRAIAVIARATHRSSRYWPTDERERLSRILAYHDGSTMRLLEAVTGLRIEFAIRDRRTTPAGEWASRLQAPAEAPVLRREVEMSVEGISVATAVARVVLARVPPKLRRCLDHGSEGLGALLRKLCVEVHREPAEVIPDAFVQSAFLCRRYRLFLLSLPAAEIVERFDLAALEVACRIVG